jgi:hypothetical protein
MSRRQCCRIARIDRLTNLTLDVFGHLKMRNRDRAQNSAENRPYDAVFALPQTCGRHAKDDNIAALSPLMP